MLNTFEKTGADGAARLGRFHTAHGAFETPNFMPVGTKATVKGVDAERLREAGAQITLVNTYHLLLRPGPELVHRMGGIHEFCGWSGPILSDSGGFQVFSLKGMRKLTEEGVEFRSHLDGARQFLSPERSIEIQETLGVDIAMALDECPAAGLGEREVCDSLDLTLRWARRSLAARRGKAAIFGITQGGKFAALRKRAAEDLGALPFDGMAIGGLSVGEEKRVMYEVLSYHAAELPGSKIRYLMGVGTPEDLVEAVYRGVDLFDCVMPTRAGRFGRAFVGGDAPFLNIRNAAFIEDGEPLDSACRCVACRNYSRAYLHHLFRADEMLGPQLLSIHNLTHYLSLMAEIRKAIAAGSFETLYRSVKSSWAGIEVGNEPPEGPAAA